ncbi:hypothetical protein NCS52_01251200 [Fusarium sp. LHS14.1]|nr:hypothetical protein NCS52_01251200 [Fusarium sp. LHS14.1]
MDRQRRTEISHTSRECDELFMRYVRGKRPRHVAIQASQQRFWAWLNAFNSFSRPPLPLDSQLDEGQNSQTAGVVLLLLGVLKQNLCLALQPVPDNKSLHASKKNDPPGTLDIVLFGIEGSLERLEKIVSAIHRATTTSLENRVLAYAGEKRDRHFEQHVDLVLQYGRPELRKLLSASFLYRHYRILHERRTDPRHKAHGKRRFSALADSDNPKKPGSSMFALERFMDGSSLFRTKHIRCPKPPTITGGQKNAVCPICRKLYSVDVFRRENWSSHVDQDLKPYVCISQTCSKNLLFFADKTSWIQHMRQVHTATWIRHLHNHVVWKCGLPHDRNPVSEHPTKESLLEHMKAEHRDICDKDEDLRNLAGSSGVAKPQPLNKCPICGDKHSEVSPWMHDDYDHNSDVETPKHKGDSDKSTVKLNLPQDRSPGDKLPAASDADFTATRENRDHQRIEEYIGKHLKALSYYFCHYLIEPPSAEDNWTAGEENDVWGPLTPVSNEDPGVHEEEEEDPRGKKRRKKGSKVHETSQEAVVQPHDDIWTPFTMWRWHGEDLKKGPFMSGTSSRSYTDVLGPLNEVRRSVQGGTIEYQYSMSR